MAEFISKVLLFGLLFLFGIGNLVYASPSSQLAQNDIPNNIKIDDYGNLEGVAPGFEKEAEAEVGILDDWGKFIGFLVKVTIAILIVYYSYTLIRPHAINIVQSVSSPKFKSKIINLLAFIVVFLFLVYLASAVFSDFGKYDGLTAEEWASEYSYLADCVELSDNLQEAKECL